MNWATAMTHRELTIFDKIKVHFPSFFDVSKLYNHEPLGGRPVVVRIYRGTQNQTSRAFELDSAEIAGEGYLPTSQIWAPETRGCADFLGPILLTFCCGIGIIIFFYMLIVKPKRGQLSVTYILQQKK